MKKSFTLIEMLVVIFIIALLASIIVINLNYARKKGRDTERISDLTKVASALQLYYVDNQTYPDTDFNGLINLLMTPSTYLEKTISGPYTYQYTAPNYWLYFDPEVINATCLECNGDGDIYLIKNGKVSDSW